MKPSFSVLVASGLIACVHASEPRQAPATLPDPESLAAPEEPGTPWERCHSAVSPHGDPEPDLERLTGACGSVGDMQAVTAVQLGEQSHGDPVDRYGFYAAESGKCYRIYAAAEQTVLDLDLLIRDPEGRDKVSDGTHDSWALAPPAEPFCVEQPGLYLVEVSVYQGSGRYALQVWGD